MSVLYIAIPVALVISLAAGIAFAYMVYGGQFDDLETPPRRILFEEPDRERGEECESR